VSLEHLDAYLDEFTFRFNRRTGRSRGSSSIGFCSRPLPSIPSPINPWGNAPNVEFLRTRKPPMKKQVRQKFSRFFPKILKKWCGSWANVRHASTPSGVCEDLAGLRGRQIVSSASRGTGPAFVVVWGEVFPFLLRQSTTICSACRI